MVEPFWTKLYYPQIDGGFRGKEHKICPGLRCSSVGAQLLTNTFVNATDVQSLSSDFQRSAFLTNH